MFTVAGLRTVEQEALSAAMQRRCRPLYSEHSDNEECCAFFSPYFLLWLVFSSSKLSSVSGWVARTLCLHVTYNTNTGQSQTPVPQGGFEPTIPVFGRWGIIGVCTDTVLG